MNEHTMTEGVIPVRQSSMPGQVRLPRRFEKAALGDASNSNHRIIVCARSLPLPETVSNRLADLKTAALWVKQELIRLRQHDILLKRQFFNIRHSIQSLQHNLSLLTTPSCTTSSTQAASETPMNFGMEETYPLSDSRSAASCPLSSRFTNRWTPSVLQLSNSSFDYHLEMLLTRSSMSVKLLSTKNDDSDDSNCDDAFFENEYHRPRTTSMRTSRDLAAMARRRESKDLI